jgi:hypothetical protein
VSRDEMAAALLEVAEGRVPRDRLALKCLLEDMQAWPFLQEEDASSSSSGGGGSSSSNGSIAAAGTVTSVAASTAAAGAASSSSYDEAQLGRVEDGECRGKWDEEGNSRGIGGLQALSHPPTHARAAAHAHSCTPSPHCT